MRKSVIFGLLLNLLVIVASYAQERKAESVPLPPQAILEVAEMPIPEPPYIYESGGRRDPFKALVSQKVESKGAQAVAEIEITSLSLSGLIWDDNKAIALLHDGGNFGYILKDGKLIGENYRIIKGIYGQVKSDGVYLTQGETQVKLTLEKEVK